MMRRINRLGSQFELIDIFSCENHHLFTGFLRFGIQNIICISKKKNQSMVNNSLISKTTLLFLHLNTVKLEIIELKLNQ